MIVNVEKERDWIIPHDQRIEDFSHLKKIAEVFQLQIVSKSYADIEFQCFDAALEACKQRKWTLIEKCQNELSKITNVAGRTLLMQAAVADWDDECLEMLFKYKSLVFQKDNEGNTALHMAAKYGSVHQLSLLFTCLRPDELNNAGETPVHTAIFNGQAQVLKALIENGANSNASFTWKSLKMTPLCIAVMRGETDCVDLLLNEANFRQNIPEIGNLLHIACHFHQTHMISHLFEKYRLIILPLLEDVNASDLTPLSFAASLGDIEAVWTLKENGANLEAEDSNKRTVLHHAALTCQPELIKLLAHFKVNPHAVDRQGKTPLALAEAKKSENLEALETYNVLSNFLTAWGSISITKHSPFASPENLAFKGGGAKGGHHVGVIKFLEEKGLLKRVKRVSGTSSGAITAAFVALGYTAKEMEELLLNKNLMDFIDDPVCKVAIEELTESDKELASTLMGYYQSLKKGKAAGNLVYDIFKKMNNTTGLCKGESFRLWMEEEIIANKVSQITGLPINECKNYTLGEHRKLFEAGKPLKHIHLFGTQLGPKQEITEFSSEDPKCDNYILSDLVRISMSIPGAFEAHCIHIKQGKDRVLYKEGGSYVDGGVLNNLPVETFDQKRYQTQKDLGKEGLCPQFNKKTLGINLTSHETIADTTPPKTMGDILKGLAKIYLNAETSIRNLNPYNKERIIDVDVGDVGTFSFNLKNKQKEDSVQRGYADSEKFFAKFEPSSTDSLFSISLEKKVKNRMDLPSLLPNFSGRKSYFSSLKKVLAPQKWKATDSTCVKVICGPAGIGKSELAIAFGNKQEELFSLIWHIPGSSRELYEQSYRELARALKITCETDPLNVILNKVNKVLESGIEGNRPWLLILDDVEFKIASSDLPKRGGSVLMTSQHKTIWEYAHDYIELPPLSALECQEYFQQTLKQQPSEAMSLLIKELGGYPILLNLAAKSIYPYQSISEYLDKVANQGMPLDESDERSRYPKALDSVFKLRFQQMKEASPEAFEFLEMCAFLNPDHIPVQLIEFYIKEKKKKVEVLKALCDSSIARFDKDKGILSFHRLLQYMLQKSVNQEKYQLTFDTLQEWARGFNPDELKTLKIGEGCLFQITELQKFDFWELTERRKRANFFYVCGDWSIKFKGDYKEGLKFHKKAYDIRKENPDIHFAASSSKVGECYCRLGNDNVGLKYQYDALDLVKNVVLDNENAIKIARFYDSLADCLSHLGQHDEALKKAKSALAIRKPFKGENSSEAAISYNNVGAILLRTGKFKEALEKFEQALDIYQKEYGADHPFVALILCNIGTIYHELKMPDKALEYFKKSLAFLKKAYPEGHHDIISPYRGILLTLFELKEYQTSYQYLQEFLPLLKKFYGEDNQHVAECLGNMGTMLNCLGKPEEALALHKQALEMYNQALGNNNTYSPGIRENIRRTEFQIQYSQGGSSSLTTWLFGGAILAFIGGLIYVKTKK